LRVTDPVADLYWRDEVLQVMYWLRGEELNEQVSAQDLAVLVPAEASFLQHHLEQLAADGFLEAVTGAPPRYRLTELGVREGGRRFAEEFAGLTGQAHGACSNPNCSCHTLGPEACEAGQQ
jgi:hypothetical protein